MWYIVRVHYRKDRQYTMNIKAILKKLLTDTSIYFTVITAIYTLIMMIVNVSDEAVGLEAERLLLIFVFSALAAFAQFILRLKALHGALRVLLHGGILMLAFYLCFLLPVSMKGAQLLIGLFAFAVVYAIIMALCALFISRFRANSEPDEPYREQFKKSRQ